MGTPKYYQVCRDIIMELCDLFEDTPYMHLGLDEEDDRHARTDKNFVAAYRQGDMLWHNLQWFMDTVRDCKKTPVMWGSTPIYRYEEFKKHIEPEDLVSKLEIVNYKRMELSEERIANARHIIATVKEKVGIKIAADGTDPDQYVLAMSKNLINFIETSPESFDVPLQFIKIGDVKFYIFHSEIFCTYGLNIKKGAGTEKCFVVTLGNGSYGYLPTKDLIYDTIYESRPGTFRFQPDAGVDMVDRLLEMGK